jgi:hypothetical protein
MGSILLFMVTSETLPEERPATPNVSIEARYVAAPEPVILFQLRPVEDHTIYEDDLPWGNFYSVRLTFRDGAGKPVCPLLLQPIDDPSSIHVALRQDQTISGRVKLLEYCRSLPRLLAQGDVTVEWAYTPVMLRGSGEPLHGQVRVGRSK